jgi:hypothetical protein
MTKAIEQIAQAAREKAATACAGEKTAQSAASETARPNSLSMTW